MGTFLFLFLAKLPIKKKRESCKSGKSKLGGPVSLQVDISFWKKSKFAMLEGTNSSRYKTTSTVGVPIYFRFPSYWLCQYIILIWRFLTLSFKHCFQDNGEYSKIKNQNWGWHYWKIKEWWIDGFAPSQNRNTDRPKKDENKYSTTSLPTSMY